MKVPDPKPPRPRLYTIPPSAPFLSTLAKALLNGDLPSPGGAKPDPLTLPLATIYLPTRRAVRALREAFLDASGGKAALLPRIRALGDPDEDAAVIFGAEAEWELGVETAAAPAIEELPRRLALLRLVLAWQRTLQSREPLSVEVPPKATPAQASYLAADLARLMDFVESEETDLSALAGVVPENHADHWTLTTEFLEIVTVQWPKYLAENGLVSPALRRKALMDAESARLAANPPPGPIIAAGSTGSIPATARLLAVIASLPRGAVVLPGLDRELDEASWESLAEHPEHPQAGMADLLRKLGAVRDDVAYLPGSEPNDSERARLSLMREVLRPADETHRWREFLDTHAKRAEAGLSAPAGALAGVNLIEAPTAHDEAEAIALIMRAAVESEHKTAALITLDRVLARRVAARLRSFNLLVDDSAGVPVARTVPGSFLDLVLGAVETAFAPPQLMALLKHPLTLLGGEPRDVRTAARALERAAFREIYVGQGLAGVANALDAARSSTDRRHRATRLGEEEHHAAKRLVADLEHAFAPLAALYAAPGDHSAASFAEALVRVAEALARDRAGSSAHLWQGDAGEALSVMLAEMIDAGGAFALTAPAYAPFYRSLLQGRVARPRRPAHPRLFIWGPLEARLQQPDLVILGGLNEGTWPRPQAASPWLNRPMSDAIGLPPPERRTGLAAHDFAQALGAPTVYLSRAIKVDGVPTVRSRWLQRLTALVEAAGLSPALEPSEPWISWARDRDQVRYYEPVSAPKPCPPVEARPRRLSVSRIERMIANPYEIFARDILKLEPLKPLGAELDHAFRGQIVHAALHAFAREFPDALPEDIAGRLIALADAQFAALGGSPRVEAFWRPAFARFAHWFAATEPTRRARGGSTHTELDGSLDIDSERGFRLTARADRIDLTPDGALIIYDYKTGSPPTSSHVERLYAPQLPLEAAIAAGGGFPGLGKRPVAELRYIQASGRGDGGTDEPAANATAAELANQALQSLVTLIARYDRPDTPYEAKRRPGNGFDYRYDTYEQLARVKEWLTQEAEEDWT
jgi:ATP-dependent helicase/nuclease subunit B